MLLNNKSNLFKKLYSLSISLCILTFLLALKQFLFRHEKDVKGQKYNEMYDSSLNSLDNMKKLKEYLDKTAMLYNIKVHSREYVDLTRDIVARRFYHGYACYNIRNNWIAFLAGTFIWNHFLGIVIPDDILKYNGALCSQQAIVFGKLLKMEGYEVRVVGLKGHFCKEVFYDNSWHFYDPDKEPNFPNNLPRPDVKHLASDVDQQIKAYSNKLDKISLSNMFSEYTEGEINAFPAKKMTFFHYVTRVLSNWLWILFLYLAIYFKIKAFRIS